MKKSIFIVFTLSSTIILSLAFTSGCTKAKAPAPMIGATCSDTISFTHQIAPVIQDKCSSCHGSGAGTSPVLSNYAEIADQAENILNALHGTPQLMPQGGPALEDSLIRQFDCWIQQGKMDN
ncbi:hypothetical protein D3C71_776430 [compost metagenome]